MKKERAGAFVLCAFLLATMACSLGPTAATSSTPIGTPEDTHPGEGPIALPPGLLPTPAGEGTQPGGEPTATPSSLFPTPASGDTQPGRDATPTPPYPLPTPASLDTFLCCGTTPGETGTIWSVSHPSDWHVTLLPNNPNQFFGALFSSPNGNVVITFIPGSNTEPGHPLDTGNVDEWLNRFVQIRRGEVSGFQEIVRQPVPGVPDSRLWAATWGSGADRAWEAYLVVVSPLPVVFAGAPQGYLTMYGVRATSREWNNAVQTYDAMMKSMKVKKPDGSSSGLPMREPAVKPFLVRWCPRTCDWMAVDADSPDWVGDCGEPTHLWETPCR